MNERPVEYSFLLKCIALENPSSVLDVGCGRTALPQLIDNCGIQVVATDANKKIAKAIKHVVRENILKTKIKQRFNLVSCVSVLEHIQDSDTAIKNLMALTEPNGLIVVTFPFSRAHIPNVYEMPGNKYG